MQDEITRNYRRHRDGAEVAVEITVAEVEGTDIYSLTLEFELGGDMVTSWLGYMDYYNENDILRAADEDMAEFNMTPC